MAEAATHATPQMLPALTELGIGQHFGQDAVLMANDLLRVLSIQVAIQLMMVLSDPSGATAYFSPGFLALLVYVTLGVMLYWLAVRRLLVFV